LIALLFDLYNMDSNDNMMLHQLLEEEANAAIDEEEHFTVLACLLRLQADGLENTAPGHGGL
jgi:acyl carrier protein